MDAEAFFFQQDSMFVAILLVPEQLAPSFSPSVSFSPLIPALWQIFNATDSPAEVAIAGAGPSNSKVVRSGKGCPVPLGASLFGEIFVRPIVPGAEFELGGPLSLSTLHNRSLPRSLYFPLCLCLWFVCAVTPPTRCLLHRFQLVSSVTHNQLISHLPPDSTVFFEFSASLFVKRGMNVSGRLFVTDNGVAFQVSVRHLSTHDNGHRARKSEAKRECSSRSGLFTASPGLRIL